MGGKSNYLKATLLALVAYSSWVMNDSAWKFLSSSGLPFTEILGLSSLVTVACIVFFTFLRGNMRALKTKKLKFELIRSFLLLLLSFAVIFALSKVSITIFYIGNFAAPLVASILAAVFLRERPSFLQALAIVAGFAGVLIAIDPLSVDWGGADALGYAALALCSLLTGTIFVMLRSVCASETPESAAFIPHLMRVVVLVPLSLLWFRAPSFNELMIIIIAGAFNSIGFFVYAFAAKHAPVHITSPYQYSQIISAALMGFLVWHEIPGMNLWIGTVIIVISGIYIMMSGKKAPA